MKKYLALIIVLAVLCCGFVAFIELTGANTYNDSKEFEEFANKALYKRELFKKNSDTSVDYEYNELFSTAIRKDRYSGEEISLFRDEIIEDKLEGVQLAIVSAEEQKDAYACIIDTSVQESGNGAESLVVYTKLYEEQGKDMVLKNSDVQSFLFSQESGNKIDPLQALNVNYKSKASKFAKDYFTKAFSKDKLKDGWEEYITDNDDNFNKFIITGNSVIFYFDEDTVSEPENGVIPLKIPFQFMQSAVRPKVLERYIDPNKPMVAITYDDGPGGESEAKILKYLEEHGAVATFFYQGYMLKYSPETAKKAAEIGCEIGNHSWDHPQLSLLSKKQIARQIDRTNDRIEEVVGVRPELIRPPYGDYNKKVTNVVKSKEMSAVLWTIDTRDWESRDAKKIVKSVKSVKNLDGKIILMHSIYGSTAKATKKLLPYLEKKGYQTVTISELIKYKTGKTLKPGKVYRTIK